MAITLSPYRKKAALKRRRLAMKHKLDLNHWLERYNKKHLVEGKGWARGLMLVVNPRLKRALGRACYDSKIIELSPQILKESDENQRETFIHELCHFISYYEYNQSGHGSVFHALMQEHFCPNRKKSRYHQTKLAAANHV